MNRASSHAWIGVLMLLLACRPASAQSRDETVEWAEQPFEPRVAEQYFQEARAIVARDGGRLWGIAPRVAILLVDPETRRVMASRSDREGLLRQEDGVYVGTLPPEETIGGTAKQWGGVLWAMLPWPLPEAKLDRAAIMAHEMWHTVQGQLDLGGGNPANSHLDTKEGRIWLRLEWRALESALRQTGEAGERAISDALIFRAHRRSLFPSGAHEERVLEMNEGLAEYTGAVMADGTRATAIKLALKDLDRAKDWKTFVRSFAYASGPAYGLLLDEAKPDWRKALSPTHDLGDMLATATGASLPANLRSEAESRAAHYDGVTLIEQETQREETRQRILAEYRAKFVKGPILKIPLRQIEIQFDPRNLKPLDNLGTVYPTMVISADFGVLTVTGGALLSPDWTTITVVAPTDAELRPVRGDGWTLELQPGWVLKHGPRAGDFALKRR